MQRSSTQTSPLGHGGSPFAPQNSGSVRAQAVSHNSGSSHAQLARRRIIPGGEILGQPSSASEILAVLLVVRLTPKQGERPIQLLDEHDAREPVRQRQLRERPHFFRLVAHALAMAFVAADREDELACLLLRLADEARQLDGAPGLAAFVERDQRLGGRQLREDRVGFFVGALLRRKLDYVDLDIVAEPARVFIDRRLE